MHHSFIHRCLTLATQGRGHTGVNPMVGAVLVRDGKIIAEALHDGFGGLHAEALLIKKCDQEIQQEDRLYINLEPCCHTDKKTPPCTKTIIDSGIKSVVIGMEDPNPAVAGKGITELRNYGIRVIVGIERARCEWFNRGFATLMTKGRPWITLKKAQTCSGAIAYDDGSKMKITSAAQDVWSHQYLRASHDAILVGVGTIVSDDPLLTCRIDPSTLRQRSREKLNIEHCQPLRIILDPHLRIPLSANVVSEEMAKRTMLVTKDTEDPSGKMQELRDRGVQVVSIPVDHAGMFDLQALFRVLTTPTKDFYGITSILVEGGRKTWEEFRKAAVVDCEVTLIGSK